MRDLHTRRPPHLYRETPTEQQIDCQDTLADDDMPDIPPALASKLDRWQDEREERARPRHLRDLCDE